MPDPQSAPQVHAETREQWREWLKANHGREASVWLISWKKATGRPIVSYDDAVSEALAVGWVDSKPRKLDDERTMLYFSRRNPKSAWSRPNTLRVARLREEGLMTEAGEKVIAEAERCGSWNLLDDVENLVVPDDLAHALRQYRGASENWERLPRSARRGILEWIVQAKQPSTRQSRVDEAALRASTNERAAQWRPKAGPA